MSLIEKKPFKHRGEKDGASVKILSRILTKKRKREGEKERSKCLDDKVDGKAALLDFIKTKIH